MPRIHNDQLIREVREAAKIQVGEENPPSILANQVVPVIEVNPKILKEGRVVGNQLNNATSVTLLNTPSNQDVYICSIAISFSCDATATNTSISVRCIQGGTNQYLLYLQKPTLTAIDSVNHSIVFPHPIKVDRGTAITVNSDTNVANFTCRANVHYFLDEQND